MSADLVLRLRQLRLCEPYPINPDGPDAADEIERLRAENERMREALTRATVTIVGVYQHLERVEKAGGATCIGGIAACNTMLKSMRKNASRIDELVMEPARALLEGKAK
jgi:hypothetical protein